MRLLFDVERQKAENKVTNPTKPQSEARQVSEVTQISLQVNRKAIIIHAQITSNRVTFRQMKPKSHRTC